MLNCRMAPIYLALFSCGAVALAGCQTRAGYHVSTGTDVVVYDPPPPPPAAYAVPPAPYAGAVWIDGHWRWSGARYVWAHGYYVRPRAGYVYVQPRWVRRGSRYVYRQGTWRARSRARVNRSRYHQRHRGYYRRPRRGGWVRNPSRGRGRVYRQPGVHSQSRGRSGGSVTVRSR